VGVGAGKLRIDITSAVWHWQLATRCLIPGLGFRGQLSNEDIAKMEGLRDVAMVTNFGTKIAITGFV